MISAMIFPFFPLQWQLTTSNTEDT